MTNLLRFLAVVALVSVFALVSSNAYACGISKGKAGKRAAAKSAVMTQTGTPAPTVAVG